MLPSSGLFGTISCPSSLRRGLCERPHCLYQHDGREARGVFGATMYKPSLSHFAGVQQHCLGAAASGALLNASETSSVCMEELERLNRQIEAVRNEVAVEQRRLSHYQSVKTDSKRTSETISKPVNGDSSRPPSSLTRTQPHYCASKYVVDNSKPRTDLEYDPLSNFSAGLRPLGKDQKVKAARRVGKRDVSSNDLNKLSTFETQLAVVEPSPESEVDDCKEEGDLIIDIPPSPARKRSRAQRRRDDDIATESQDDAVIDVKKFKPAPIVSLEAKDVDGGHGEDDIECLSRGSAYQQRRSEPSDAGVFDDLTKCLEDLRSKSSQDVECVAERESSQDVKLQGLPETSESSQDQHQQQLVIVEDERKTDEEINPSPSPPRDAPREASPPLMDSVTSANTSCHRLPLQALTAEQLPQWAPNYNNRHPMQSVTSVPSCGQKVSEQSSGAAATTALTSPENFIEEETSIASAAHALHVLPTSVQAKVTNGMERQFSVANQLSSEAAGPENEIVDSSLDEAELNCSDVDLSDSDPMEECYRIFMEDRREKGATEQNNLPVPDAETEMPECSLINKVLPEKNGMSHLAKHIEQPVANSRPQPQMLVPLQQEPSGSGTTTIQLFATSKTPQLQQSALTRSASMKSSSSSHQKPVAVQPPLSQNTASKPVHSVEKKTYVNCIPVGTTVIQVGNRLHFILPEGTGPLPIASLGNAITPILTPITPMQACRPANALNPLQTHRRPPSQTPLHTSTSNPVSGHASAASRSAPHAALHAPAKPVGGRRKMKQPAEVKEKVPHDVRQRYVTMFTEELLKSSPSVKDAFDKAVAEERSVFNRSNNKLKYLSVAVNALKKLKSQSTVSATGEKEAIPQMSRGKVPLNVKAHARNGDAALYESLKEYIMTEEMLMENNYPLQHPQKPGSAALFADKRGTTDPKAFKKICSRCGATYSVNQTGKHTRKEECNYHNGKGVEKRVPGGVETRYSCCQAVIGAPGCQVFKLHVHDAVSLEGFVSTRPRDPEDKSCPRVYSLNCEMCYTTAGLELSRVTVVNSGLQVIYDTFIRPDNEVIDYNTRFSGISEDDMKGIKTSMGELQETLLSFIHADTILIGHSLESDLCALKLIHGVVMDISVVFPHRLGPPHKVALNTLVADHLRRIIQDSVSGHDTAEDATACMELMLWKIKEDSKAKVKRF